MNFGDKPTTTSGSSMGQYPEWMKKDMLEAQDAYKNLYEHNLEAGYRPYTGMTTAGFTPEQIASQQGLASLVGSQAPMQQEAAGLTRGLTSEFTPDQAQKYMSPYLRASLDAQKAAAQRQFEGTKLPQLEAEAVAAGGMSGLGSRAGVQAAELQAGQNRLMADLEATGQQKAYEDAQNLFKSQKDRERQTALALQNLNKEIFTGGIKEQALLDAIGGEKQQMAQTMLDEAQTKYYDKEEFARNELNKWYQSLLGNPIWKQPNYEKTGTQGGGGPGMGKTLTSLISTGIGLFSDERMKTDVQKLPKKDKETGLPLYAFRYKGDPKNYPKVVGPMAQEVEKKYPNSVDEVGGRKVIKAAGGGGLSSIDQARRYMNYMRRNMGGQVVPPMVYRQEGEKVFRKNPLRRGRIPLPSIPELQKKEDIVQEKRKKGIGSALAGIAQTPVERYQVDEVGGISNLLRKDRPKVSTDISEVRPILAEDIAQTKRELGNIPYDAERRESIELYGSESGDDTGGGIGDRNIALQNLAIDRTPIPAKEEKGKTALGTTKAAADAARAAVDGEVAARAAQITSEKGFNESFSAAVRSDIKSYGDKVEARLGKDPYQRQKFWFTVASAIGKKGGNAFTNLADGLKEATNNLDLDRKEKDKLLNALDKQRLNLETKLKGHELKGKLRGAKLTQGQQTLLAKKSQFVHDAVIKAMNAGASYKKALAAAMREERMLLVEQRKQKSGTKIGDYKTLNDMFVNSFSSINPVFGIGKGTALNKKQLGQKATIMTNAGDILNGDKRYRGETGPNAASAYMQNEARNYKS